MLLALAALLLPALASPTPAEILEEARAAQRVDSSIQEVKMVLVSRSGGERVREMRMVVRKDGELIKSYTRFSAPSDVEGTQLVMVDHPDRADEQLLYLPALKRVNRIAGKARSGSFMGSDFAFEDLELSATDEGSHTLLSETEESWVIQTLPGDSSSYSKLELTVSKADKLPRKVSFYDKKGQLLKVLEVEEVGTDQGSPFPVRSVMRNVQKGTSTVLTVKSYQLDVPAEQIPDEMFTTTWMERNG